MKSPERKAFWRKLGRTFSKRIMSRAANAGYSCRVNCDNPAVKTDMLFLRYRDFHTRRIAMLTDAFIMICKQNEKSGACGMSIALLLGRNVIKNEFPNQIIIKN
jgi:hypothetical protein